MPFHICQETEDTTTSRRTGSRVQAKADATLQDIVSFDNLKAAPSVEDFDLGEASEVDDEESQLKAFVGLPGSSGHNKKEAKPKPKAKLSKWEEASQISKETTTEQLQQKAIRFMVDFF